MYIKRKYQVGGIAYTPYLPAQTGSPQTSATAATTTGSSSSSSDKISGTMKKEIVDLLKENGIPSDVSVFLNTANRLLANSQSLSQLSIFGGDREDYDISDLIKVQQLVNNVKYNKGLRDEAAAQITKENAGSEVAVSNSGELYVFNSDGKLTTVSAKEYADNKDNYQVLTNSQLMYYRETQPELAFQTGILDDLHNTIGMNSITKYLRDTINAFGSDTLEGYTVKNPEVKNGLQLLMQAGPDGYYKFTTEEELRDVNRALDYLYNGMSDSAKHLIIAKTAVEDGNPTDRKDVYNLMYQALMEHTSRSTKVDFDKQATEYDPNLTGKKGGSSSEQLTQGTLPDEIARGHLQQTTAYISPIAERVADTAQMAIAAWNAGPLSDKDKNGLTRNNLEVLLPKVFGLRGANLGQITFGNQVIDPNQKSGIIWDGSSQLTRVALPKKISDNGYTTPDFTALVKFNEVQRYIKDHPGISKLEIRDKLGEISDDVNITEDNTLVFKPEKMGFFISFAGYASRDIIKIEDQSKPFLQHLSKIEAAALKDEYNKLVQYGKLDPSKKEAKSHNYGDSGRNDFYYGNIYVPILDSTQGFLMSNDQFYTKDTFSNVAEKAYLNQIVQSNALQDQFITNFN